MRIGNENLFYYRQVDVIVTGGQALNSNRLDLAFEITVLPKLETIFPCDCDDVILDSPTSLFQGKRPVFPALSEFGRGFLGSASVFAPVKEGLVAPVETFNDILRGLRSKLIPVLVSREPFQLRQMRLHTISGNVFPIDSIVSLLQCKEMIPDLTCDFYHVVEMPGSIRDIELV